MNRSAHCVPPGPSGTVDSCSARSRTRARRHHDPFLLRRVIFCALAIGGIFVTSAQLAKTQTTNDVTTGAQLAAAGNLTLPQLSSCQTNVPRCWTPLANPGPGT